MFIESPLNDSAFLCPYFSVCPVQQKNFPCVPVTCRAASLGERRAKVPGNANEMCSLRSVPCEWTEEVDWEGRARGETWDSVCSQQRAVFTSPGALGADPSPSNRHYKRFPKGKICGWFSTWKRNKRTSPFMCHHPLRTPKSLVLKVFGGQNPQMGFWELLQRQRRPGVHFQGSGHL